MINTKLISTIAIAFLAGTMVTSFFSSTAAAVSPFDELRAAILHLQDEINHIQLIPGPQGPPGPPGPGSSITFYDVFNQVSVGPASEGQSVALCHTGDSPTGGGYTLEGLSAGDAIVQNSIFDSGSDKGWAASLLRTPLSTGSITLVTSVICAHQGS